MSNPRGLIVALSIIALAFAPVIATSVGLGSPSIQRAFAAPGMAPAAQDDDDDGGDDDDRGNDDEDGNNDGDDGNNDGVDGDDDDGVIVADDDEDGGDDNGGDDDDEDDDGGNDNDGDDGGDDDGGDDDGGDDDEDDDGPASPFVPGYTPPAAAPARPSCSTPGQETSFTSGDGTVSVRVPAGLSQGVRFSIRKPVDAGSVPAVPGQRVGGLLFELLAESCDGQRLTTLPGEVNLGMRYADGDVGSLNEASFKIARLDQSTWKATEKQSPDPGANYVSATITELGYFVVHVP